MYGNWQKQTGFNRDPAINKTSIAHLDKGQSYKTFLIRVTDGGVGLSEADLRLAMRFVRLKINTRTKRKHSPVELFDVCQAFYLTHLGFDQLQDGYFLIHMVPPYLAYAGAADQLALGTAGVEFASATLEIDWHTTDVKGADGLDLWALVGPNHAPGNIVTWRREELTVDAAKQDDDNLSDLVERKDTQLLSIHFNKGDNPGVIDASDGVDFLVNGISHFQMLEGGHDQVGRLFRRDPQADWIHIDLMLRDLYRDRLFLGGSEKYGQPDVDKLKLAIKWSTKPGTYERLICCVEPAIQSYG